MGSQLKWAIRRRLHQLGWWNAISRLRLYAAYRLKIPHEEEYHAFRHFADASGLFLDVGANAGQTLASFRAFNRGFRVISFEPNRALEPLLRWCGKRFGGNFEFHGVALGNSERTETLYFPVVDGIALTQEASFHPGQFTDDPTTISRIAAITGGKTKFRLGQDQVTTQRLDHYGLAPDFLKLDVQGSEREVILGAEETLSKHEPTLIVENGPRLLEIWDLISRWKYHPYFYDADRDCLIDATTCPRPRLNAFFISARRKRDFEAVGLFKK